MKVETSGTSTSENAGLGLVTVRAQSQAMTVSTPAQRPEIWPLPHHFRCNFDRGVELADRFSASSRIHCP